MLADDLEPDTVLELVRPADARPRLNSARNEGRELLA